MEERYEKRVLFPMLAKLFDNLKRNFSKTVSLPRHRHRPCLGKILSIEISLIVGNLINFPRNTLIHISDTTSHANISPGFQWNLKENNINLYQRLRYPDQLHHHHQHHHHHHQHQPVSAPTSPPLRWSVPASDAATTPYLVYQNA